MNLYFLVEGKRTERKVYPKWLSHLMPSHSQVDVFDSVRKNNYYLVSGEGYPSLLDNHLSNAIKDVNSVGLYDYLVVCVDAEDGTVQEREKEIHQYVKTKNLEIKNATLKLIVQNRCIETWFLGNPNIVTGAPQSKCLRNYIDFYDVSTKDPEQMGIFGSFPTHAGFHGAYLREMFVEKNIIYSKQCPGHVADSAYLRALLDRVKGDTQDLGSFRQFVEFCNNVSALSK